MTLPWFRFYHETLDDPKVQKLDPVMFKHWVNILCIACRNDGKLPSNDDLAFALRVDDIALESVLDRLLIGGLIEIRKGGENGSYIAPNGWDKRQYKSDTSNERVKRYRSAKRNVTVTPPDTDTDTDISPNGDCETSVSLKPEHFVEEWNNVADRLGKPKVRDLTPERRQLLKARIKQYSIDDFVTVLQKVSASPFLRGDKNWKGATFDWIIKKGNFQKTIEGNYDE